MWKFPDSIFLDKDPIKGRCIRTRRDIQEGETIFKEKPYCFILFNEYNNEVCDYCFEYIAGFKEDEYIRCKNCRKVSYCSKNCMYKSKKLHDLECSILKSEIMIDISNKCNVTFDRTRLLVRFIIETLIEFFDNDSNSKENSFLLPTYQQINLLVDNKDNFLQENLQIYEQLSNCVLEIPQIKNKLIKFSCQDKINNSILVKVLCIIDSNSFGIPVFSVPTLKENTNRINIESLFLSRNNDVKPKNSLELAYSLLSPNIIGWGLFSYSSLINHSCDPNCGFIGINQDLNRTLIIEMKANRKIIKGEEITINYIELYESRRNRLKSLLKTKHFRCQCQRCSSLLQDSKDLYLESYICTKCYKNHNSILVSDSNIDYYNNKDDSFFIDDQDYLISKLTDTLKCKYCNQNFFGSEIININNDFLNTIKKSEYLNNEEYDLQGAISLISNLLNKYQDSSRNIAPHPMNQLFYKCYKLLAFWSIMLDDWNTVNIYISKMIDSHIFIFNNNNNIDTSNLYSTKAIALNKIGKLSEAEVFWYECLKIREICCGINHPLFYFIPLKK